MANVVIALLHTVEVIRGRCRSRRGTTATASDGTRRRRRTHSVGTRQGILRGQTVAATMRDIIRHRRSHSSSSYIARRSILDHTRHRGHRIKRIR